MSDIILTVTPYELDGIMNGLAELPFKYSAGIIQKLLNQANVQRQPSTPLPNIGDLNGSERSSDAARTDPVGQQPGGGSASPDGGNG